MSSLTSKIESILFINTSPVPVKKLVKMTGAQEPEVQQALDAISTDYDEAGKGISLMRVEDTVQFVTNAENVELVEEFVRNEFTGELTRPALETLTIIAYRGPITKTELELIRGVNCSLILRNLLMRGLIEEQKSKEQLIVHYQITFEFLQYLGVSSVKELPDYEHLSSHEIIEKLLEIEDES